MAKHLKTRRDALRKIVGTMAAAAALSAAQMEALLAQVKRVPDLTRLRNIRTTDNSVKALKIMLSPRGQAARVFESEFGRKPAMKPSRNIGCEAVCPAHLGVGGACPELECSLVVCNGLNLGSKVEVGAEVMQQSQRRTNAASGDCDKGFDKSSGCPGYWPCTDGLNKWDKAQWLRDRQTDQYIMGLMREFGVSRAEDLAAQLEQTLADRRVGR